MRKKLLCRLLCAALLCALPCGSASAGIPEDAAALTAKIAQPSIPQDVRVNVEELGAISADRKDDLPAFQQAIQQVHDQGGGVVVVPVGHFYLAGPLTLLSNVELHLEDGAVVEFSDHPRDYEKHIVLTRFECTECYNYSPFIYANGAENIAITGSGKERQGTIDGHGEAWWPWVGAGLWKNCAPSQSEDSENLKDMGNSDVPVEKRVFGKGHYLRPVLIGPYASKRIFIKGVRIKDSPMYNVAPMLCENVTVDKVTIQASGPNTDGIDPDACRNVWIKNSSLTTGDDCIAIKAGRDGDGRRVGVATENVIIENNVFHDGHGGVTVGSEMAGGVHHVYSLNNRMDSPNLRWAYRFKTNSMRGGGLTDFYAYGDTIQQVGRAVMTVDMAYGGGDIGDFTPDIHGLHFEKITANAHNKPLGTIETYERNPVYDFTWKDCTLTHVNVYDKQAIRCENTPQENITYEQVTVNGKPYQGPGK